MRRGLLLRCVALTCPSCEGAWRGRCNEALSGEVISKMGGTFSNLGSSWLGCTVEADSAAKVMEIGGNLLLPSSCSVPLS